MNIGSGTFFLGSPTRAHYVASKGGVIGLSRVLSRELAPANIRVNVIVPGSTLSEDDPSDDVVQMRSAPIANRSIKRIEMPEDLTGAAVFFLSDDSAFVTGQTLVLQGTGLVNGELAPTGEPYGFTIRVTDGEQDTFRIRIWYLSLGNDFTRYDSGVQAISGNVSVTTP